VLEWHGRIEIWRMLGGGKEGEGQMGESEVRKRGRTREEGGRRREKERRGESEVRKRGRTREEREC
jgi:hypothetical protein